MAQSIMPWLSSSKRRKLSLSNTIDSDDTVDTQAYEMKIVQPKLSGIAKLLVLTSDPNQMEDALSKLHRLLDDGKEAETTKNRKLAIDLGAPTRVVMILTQSLMHKDIQVSCFKILSSLTFESKIARFSVIEMGGVEAILSAINMFPLSVELREFGFMTIMNTLSGDDEEGKASREKCSRRFVEELGGLDLLEQSMSSFLDHAGVQASCCGLLCNLSTNKKFFKAMVKTDLIASTGKALQYHFNHDGVREAANAFNSQMCGKEKDSKVCF